MKKTAKIKTILKLAEIYKDSSDIYELYNFIVLAAEDKTYNELLEIFKVKFPNENVNKIHSFARQYQLAFQGQPDEYLDNLEGVNNLNEVLQIIKNRGRDIGSKKDRAIIELKQKYPNHLSEIEELTDTSTKIEYYPWILSVLNTKDTLKDIVKLVFFYDKNNLKKDIKLFTTSHDLRAYLDKELLKPVGNNDVVDKDYLVYKNEPQAKNPRYTDFIYNSENFIVVLPGTVPSSQYWASGTVWCTGWARGNLFESYSASERLFLFYIITKNPEIFKDDKAKKKISVGYRIGSNKKPIFITNMNASVDSGNNNLNLKTIEKYLGNESSNIFNAINLRMISNPLPKYTEFVNNLNVEEYKKQLEYLSREDIIKLNNRLENRPNLSPELSEEVLKSYAKLSPFEFLSENREEFIALRKDENVLDTAFENLAEIDPSLLFNENILDSFGSKKYYRDDIWLDKFINALKVTSPDILEVVRNNVNLSYTYNKNLGKLNEKLRNQDLDVEFEDSMVEVKPDIFLSRFKYDEKLTVKNNERIKVAIKNYSEKNPLGFLGEYYYLSHNEYNKIIHNFIIQNLSSEIFDSTANKIISTDPFKIIELDYSYSHQYSINNGLEARVGWIEKAFISLVEKKQYETYCKSIFGPYHAAYAELRSSPKMLPYNLTAVKGLLDIDAYSYFSMKIYEYPEYEKFIKEAFLKAHKQTPENIDEEFIDNIDYKYRNLIGVDLINSTLLTSKEQAAKKFIEDENYTEYFLKRFHTDPELKNLTDIAAKNCSSGNFFRFYLHKTKEYSNLGPEKIEQLNIKPLDDFQAEDMITFFTERDLDEGPYEYKFIDLLKNIIEEYPQAYFYRGLEKNPEYKDLTILAAKKYMENIDSNPNGSNLEFKDIAKKIIRDNDFEEEYDLQEELVSGHRPFGITRGKLKKLESALNKIGCRSDRLSRLIKII